MTSLHETDYDQLATQVVDNFFTVGEALNDGVLKVAEDKDLNPEQIKRIVESANTKAFLKIFKDKGDGDKNVEFDVADPQKIMDMFYKKPTCVSVTKVTITKSIPSGGFDEPMPDMLKAERNSDYKDYLAEDAKEDKDTKEEKTASTSEGTSPMTKKARMQTTLRMRKVAEELYNRIYECEHEYADTLDKVAAEFCKLYGPTYEDFEVDAIHRHANNDFVKFALNDIRKCMHWKTDMYQPAKGALQTKIASSETAEMVQLNKMVDMKKLQLKLASGIKLVNKDLESLLI